jgi:hypothetical protein
MEEDVKATVLAFVSALALAYASHAWAHGDQPHPKCKKGYELNDAYKCVKKN